MLKAKARPAIGLRGSRPDLVETRPKPSLAIIEDRLKAKLVVFDATERSVSIVMV